MNADPEKVAGKSAADERVAALQLVVRSQESALERYRRDAERYAFVRTLNAGQFTRLYVRSLTEPRAFDECVDLAMELNGKPLRQD